MGDVLLEICCGSVDDALQAQHGGADRVELNSALALGGLTPSLGALTLVKRHTTLPVIAMVRPRAGGFCLTPMAFETALADARALLSHGADGVAFGFLREDGTIDEARTRAMVALADGRETVFHRAFDVTPDWRRALETLIHLGVTRVLTSGQAASAPQGAKRVAEMIAFAGGAIEILPGAGIRPHNVAQLVRETGCTQVHCSAQALARDDTEVNARGIAFAALPEVGAYGATDAGQVARMRAVLRGKSANAIERNCLSAFQSSCKTGHRMEIENVEMFSDD